MKIIFLSLLATLSSICFAASTTTSPIINKPNYIPCKFGSGAGECRCASGCIDAINGACANSVYCEGWKREAAPVKTEALKIQNNAGAVVK